MNQKLNPKTQKQVDLITKFLLCFCMFLTGLFFIVTSAIIIIGLHALSKSP